VNPNDFKQRTRGFAVRVIRLTEALPKSTMGTVIGKQLLRCGTAVGANYRSACRAKSRADFIAKMKIVEEECDESLYWMDLLIESRLVRAALLDDLVREADEILALVVASIKAARSHKQTPAVNRQSSIDNRQYPAGSVAAHVA